MPLANVKDGLAHEVDQAPVEAHHGQSVVLGRLQDEAVDPGDPEAAAPVVGHLVHDPSVVQGRLQLNVEVVSGEVVVELLLTTTDTIGTNHLCLK